MLFKYADTSSEDSTETVPTRMGEDFFLNCSISSIRALYFDSVVRNTKSLRSALAIGTFVGMMMTFRP